MIKKWASVLLALSLFCFLSLAQQFTQLSGTISDPTGAIVPSAEVTIQNTLTGAERSVQTDASGIYRFPQVQPGPYKLTAKSPGFNDVIIGNLVLEVGRPATQNVVFEKVGATSTVISISAEATQLNTTDSSVGNVVNSTAILELPSFARNLAGLLAFQPGVTSVQNVNAYDDRSGSVNGGRSDQANVTLDGMDVNQQSARRAFTSVLRSTLDSTQEFRSTTSGAGAEFGRSSGAQIQLVTRSGTNEYHGAAYWYHRNTVTAANTFFNNLSGVPRAPLLINIPGGRLGGPIIKNKLFFFLNFETRRDASSANVLRFVPSELMKQGIVHYTNTAGQLTSIGPDGFRALDPRGIGVSQAALALMRDYPVANDNTAGDGLNRLGYRFNAPLSSRQNTYITRWDYTANDKHTFFFRGNLQNDSDQGAPQFPGQPAATIGLDNTKGYTIGHTAVVSPNLISTFSYGLTRQSFEDAGQVAAPYVTFRDFSPIFAITRTAGRTIPVHQIRQDFAWTKGRHDIRIGGVMRWIDNRSFNNTNSFSNGVTNVSWLRGVGNDIAPPDLRPAELNQYGTAAVAVLGLVTQVTSVFNFNLAGSTLPEGAIIRRNFKNEEYEWFIQDSWRMKRNLTLTLGLRHSLMPPPYEADGIQLSPSQPLGDWFNRRQGLADQGRSQAEAGPISYIVSSEAGGRPMYPFHKSNFAPRAALAWSPEGDGKLARFLFGGPGRTSVRAGWGMFYDLIGQPLAATYENNAFGFRQSFNNPSATQTFATAPRFTGFYSLPSELLAAPPRAGFPATPPATGAGSFAIVGSIDDTLKMPYVMRQNFSIGREFKDGLFIEVGYVGSLSRNNLMNRDLAMPTNPTDPASGQTYFEAATNMVLHRRAGGTAANMPAQPFFEGLYGNLRTANLTATQNIFQNSFRFYNVNDFISTLFDIDRICDPGCGPTGRGFQFNQQFSALSGWSSIGTGNYHSLQVTARKRFRDLTADFNYTWSKSIDMASRAENAGTFAGFMQNPFQPRQFRAVSDYDQRHIYNAYVVWDLPFGKGKRFGSGSNYLMDTLIGGWTISPTWQMATELPTSVFGTGVWPTNWNVTSRAVPKTGGIPAPTPEKTKIGSPNMFSDPQAARLYFDYALPGESGPRNIMRQDGTFNINLALAKRFRMPWAEGQSIQIRAEAYNLTNAVRFIDPNINLTQPANFGRYQQQANAPRQMQFAFRYDF
ncbi:carboxypeptidase-like regulatory domain-containing protein [Oscillatoria amoena NRMC-F 0135]|nr:carboxypeptidase-like regulatory domain-containing protein [Oscillatoria amoena NRMC-F 0135]